AWWFRRQHTDTVLVVEGRRRENCRQRFVAVLQSVALNPPLKLQHAVVKVPSELQRTVDNSVITH
ncbi:hypothetical protein A2U01_0096380, partial [Trifolium medium]|nr:hypothetical protein [Trifolium medium]